MTCMAPCPTTKITSGCCPFLCRRDVSTLYTSQAGENDWLQCVNNTAFAIFFYILFRYCISSDMKDCASYSSIKQIKTNDDFAIDQLTDSEIEADANTWTDEWVKKLANWYRGNSRKVSFTTSSLLLKRLGQIIFTWSRPRTCLYYATSEPWEIYPSPRKHVFAEIVAYKNC